MLPFHFGWIESVLPYCVTYITDKLITDIVNQISVFYCLLYSWWKLNNKKIIVIRFSCNCVLSRWAQVPEIITCFKTKIIARLREIRGRIKAKLIIAFDLLVYVARHNKTFIWDFASPFLAENLSWKRVALTYYDCKCACLHAHIP
jgi:hypothetical protein